MHSRIKPLVLAALVAVAGCKEDAPPPEAEERVPTPVEVPGKPPRGVMLSFETSGDAAAALEVVKRRVRELQRAKVLPTTEPDIRRAGERVIVVQLPLPAGVGARCHEVADTAARALSRSGKLVLLRAPRGAYRQLEQALRKLATPAGRTAEVTRPQPQAGFRLDGIGAAELQKRLAELPVPDGRKLVIEPWRRGPDGAKTRPPTLWVVDPTPIITGARIRDARVVDGFDGKAEVNVTLDAAGAKAFAAATERMVGEYIAIVLEGVAQSVPVVQERIAGGVARITLGAGEPEQLRREAEELAAILRAGPLMGKVTVLNRIVQCP